MGENTPSCRGGLRCDRGGPSRRLGPRSASSEPRRQLLEQRGQGISYGFASWPWAAAPGTGSGWRGPPAWRSPTGCCGQRPGRPPSRRSAVDVARLPAVRRSAFPDRGTAVCVRSACVDACVAAGQCATAWSSGGSGRLCRRGGAPGKSSRGTHAMKGGRDTAGTATPGSAPGSTPVQASPGPPHAGARRPAAGHGADVERVHAHGRGPGRRHTPGRTALIDYCSSA